MDSGAGCSVGGAKNGSQADVGSVVLAIEQELRDEEAAIGGLRSAKGVVRGNEKRALMQAAQGKEAADDASAAAHLNGTTVAGTRTRAVEAHNEAPVQAGEIHQVGDPVEELEKVIQAQTSPSRPPQTSLQHTQTSSSQSAQPPPWASRPSNGRSAQWRPTYDRP